VSVKDRVVLVPMTSLELCTDRMSDFMGPDNPSSFVTIMSNHTSMLRVMLLLLEGE
jgi:hypothetical protein